MYDGVVKADTFTFGKSYFDHALTQDTDELISNAETQLRDQNIEFDSMVGIGLSGILVLPLLARHFRVPFLALRKPGVKCHDSYGVGSYGRGTIGHNWILIDDFVSSGSTVDMAQKLVNQGIQHGRDKAFNTTFRGTYCYGACYGPTTGKFVHPNGKRVSVVRISVDGELRIVDGEAFSIIKEYVNNAIQDNYPDPKGRTINRIRLDYDYLNLDVATVAMMTVAAENEIRSGNRRFL